MLFAPAESNQGDGINRPGIHRNFTLFGMFNRPLFSCLWWCIWKKPSRLIWRWLYLLFYLRFQNPTRFWKQKGVHWFPTSNVWNSVTNTKDNHFLMLRKFLSTVRYLDWCHHWWLFTHLQWQTCLPSFCWMQWVLECSSWKGLCEVWCFILISSNTSTSIFWH